MTTQKKADIIRRYFAAYKSNDRKVVEDALAEDFMFTSPYDNAIDKAEYFRRCWPNHRSIEEHIIERIVEDGDSTYVTYRIVAAGSKEFRNTEFLTVAGDGLRSVHVYFGESYKNGVFVPQQKSA